MKDSLMKRRIVVLPVTTDATNTLFSKTVDRLMVAEDIDGAELLDGDVEEPGNYEWTPELVIYFPRLLRCAVSYQHINTYNYSIYRMLSYCLN